MTQATESEVMAFVAEIQATERAQALDLAIMRGAYVAPAVTGRVGLAIAAKLAAKSARK